MRRGTITLTVALALMALGLKDGCAAEADLPEKQTIVVQLQQAVRANDKAWLAAHARYPLSYFGHGRRVIRGKADFTRGLRFAVRRKAARGGLGARPGKGIRELARADGG